MKINSKKLASFTPIEIKITIESQEELENFKMMFGTMAPNDFEIGIQKHDLKAKPNVTLIGQMISTIYHDIKKHF